MSARPRDPFTGTAVPELWRKPLGGWPRVLQASSPRRRRWPWPGRSLRLNTWVFPLCSPSRSAPTVTSRIRTTSPGATSGLSEVPVVWEALLPSARRPGAGRLGTCSRTTSGVRHQIVDKYERSKRVRNLDVLDLGSDGKGVKYDPILVSILDPRARWGGTSSRGTPQVSGRPPSGGPAPPRSPAGHPFSATTRVSTVSGGGGSPLHPHPHLCRRHLLLGGGGLGRRSRAAAMPPLAGAAVRSARSGGRASGVPFLGAGLEFNLLELPRPPRGPAPVRQEER